MADPEEQLAGTLAKGDGPCVHPDCETGMFLKDEPITRYKDGWMHVRHAAGWDDAAGMKPATKTRKRAAKRTTTKKAATTANPPSVEDVVASSTDTPRVMSAADADEWWEQTEPGLVPGMPNDVYHRDPWSGGSVSNSDAKLLLDAPVLYRYHKDHPRTSGSRQMNLGSAAHTRVLGEGDELVKIDAAEYRTNDAKAARDAAYAAGKIPLLGVRKYLDKPCEWDIVDDMARVLEQDELAPLLFSRGRAEVSAFWICPESGVARRCRFDWLPDKIDGARMIVPDFKSTADASPSHFGKAAVDFGYAMQDWTYSSALAALGVDTDAAFVFVNQETTPPYLVSTVQLDDQAREWGHQRTLRALRRYRWCTEHDEWPGYGGEVHRVSLRPWVFDQEAYETARDKERYPL